MSYAPIILLNKFNSTSFTPAALNTKPTAIKAITKNPISFENSRLNPRYTPITAIAISTRDCALDKNQLYMDREVPDIINISNFSPHSHGACDFHRTPRSIVFILKSIYVVDLYQV